MRLATLLPAEYEIVGTKTLPLRADSPFALQKLQLESRLDDRANVRVKSNNDGRRNRRHHGIAAPTA